MNKCYIPICTRRTADAFAVSVDDQKCSRVAWIRDQMFSRYADEED